MTLRIEDYAIIGDCETAALVGFNGSIDWLCLPRFDSAACFASLLGTEENGRWVIAPDGAEVHGRRRYWDDTLILETTFETPDGVARLIDFMPMRGDCSHLVRLVVGEQGQLRFRTQLVIRFGYGAIVPWVTRAPDGTLRAIAGPDKLVLRTPVPLRGENLSTVGEFEVVAGETVPFVLSYGPSHLPDPDPVDGKALLHAAEEFWLGWTDRAQISGPWIKQVKRSLITLKALTYGPTGGVLAAPTTSLPEHIGGERNWDYRYCWLRDATWTLLALMSTGYYDEARAWQEWLLRAVAGSPDQMQIMYGLAGERQLPESELTWLAGYANSRPVRIGNGAHQQLQIDVYGELMDALHHSRRNALAPDASGWDLQKAVLQHLEAVWREPDHGIWEVRSEPRHFTYSKVMAWVAFDRAIKSANAFKLEGPVEHWCMIRDAICEDVIKNAFDAHLGTFVGYYGSRELDASLLLLPAVGFIAAQDPRMSATIAAIEHRLMRDGLVMRYDTGKSDDGLPPGEGMFLACSFWLVDAYILLGKIDRANALFERLVMLCNDVGLLSEEYDFQAKRMVGNFPQAFSHLALVNSACNLSAYKGPAEHRTEEAAVPA
jgi:GH15 family glucan-1,4-alpha-glucosidase